MKLRPPYYVVSFISNEIADQRELPSFEQIVNLSANPPGLLGLETIDDGTGQSQTKSYWADLESIRFWNMQEHHLSQQDEARRNFYQYYRLDISKCEDGTLQ